MTPIILDKHISRFITMYDKCDKKIPDRLFTSDLSEIGDLNFGEPLPFKKSETKFYAKTGEIYYAASEKFIARIDKNAKYDYDKVYVFSAKRDMPAGKILHILPTEFDLWVETESGVSHIELKNISVEEKANLLRRETLDVVDRMGMISSMDLKVPYDTSTRVFFHNCDNDGGFTAMFAIGEVCHYGVLKREKGIDDEETKSVFASAVRAEEACLLLMMIAGRDDGFPARTFITSDAVVPDDGLFMRKTDGKATVIESTFTNKKKITGNVYDASYKIPDRLTKLYRDEGYTDDDIIFKGDTSSDEVTNHFLNLYYAHTILGEDDKELDELIVYCARKLIDHIIEHNFELYDCYGKATSWAKWSLEYFTDGIGWCDAPENACEMLAYLLLANQITGDEKYLMVYHSLIEKGYADLIKYHYDRAFAAGVSIKRDVIEDLMYGDHMLANSSFYVCMKFEKDPTLRKIYLDGWNQWRRTSLGREHTPIYDIPFKSVCGEEKLDDEKIAEWFYRYNVSMLEAEPSVYYRRDVPRKEYRADYVEMSYLTPQDERAISHYDRDPFAYIDLNRNKEDHVEGSTTFTTPYWLGRYTNVIDDRGAKK